MEKGESELSEHESACARVAALFPRFRLRCYVGSKLRRDPIFFTAYEIFRNSTDPILDVGCGLGLLAFYLRERGSIQPIVGLDVDLWKTKQGNRIASRYRDIDLHCQDVQDSLPGFSGNVALIDVLHYLPKRSQAALLSHLVKLIAPGGFLVIRECPRDNTPRYWMTLLAERLGQLIAWNWKCDLHFPGREIIAAPFDGDEFERADRPLWGAMPFNNQLFVFKRRVSEAVPALE